MIRICSRLRYLILLLVVYTLAVSYRCNKELASLSPSSPHDDGPDNKNDSSTTQRQGQPPESWQAPTDQAPLSIYHSASGGNFSGSVHYDGVDVVVPDGDPSSFSACLLVLDENHRLPEWLAYHYFAARLRYLVVAVDPHSTESPTPIFDRWRPSGRMIVIEWTDSDFVAGGNRSYLIDDVTMTERQREQTHRHRQRDFYRACIQHLLERNRTWTAFIDADEYLASRLPHTRTLVRQPGSLLRIVQHYSNTATMKQYPIPWKQDNRNEQARWYDNFQRHPCVTLGRILYGAREQNESVEAAAGHEDSLPSFVDPHNFDTLRWKYRAAPDDFEHNGRSKAILDVSRLEPRHLNRAWTNPHQPLTSVCRTDRTRFDEMPLGFHHYLGSWESYSHRDDARASKSHGRAAWEEKSVLGFSGEDGSAVTAHDEIRPWVAGFLAEVGEQPARSLVKGAGVLRFKKSNEPS